LEIWEPRGRFPRKKKKGSYPAEGFFFERPAHHKKNWAGIMVRQALQGPKIKTGGDVRLGGRVARGGGRAGEGRAGRRGHAVFVRPKNKHNVFLSMGGFDFGRDPSKHIWASGKLFHGAGGPFRVPLRISKRGGGPGFSGWGAGPGWFPNGRGPQKGGGPRHNRYLSNFVGAARGAPIFFFRPGGGPISEFFLLPIFWLGGGVGGGGETGPFFCQGGQPPAGG